MSKHVSVQMTLSLGNRLAFLQEQLEVARQQAADAGAHHLAHVLHKAEVTIGAAERIASPGHLGRTRDEWVPASDPPPVDVVVLGWLGDEAGFVWYDGEQWRDVMNVTFSAGDVTHWRPEPAGPDE